MRRNSAVQLGWELVVIIYILNRHRIILLAAFRAFRIIASVLGNAAFSVIGAFTLL